MFKCKVKWWNDPKGYGFLTKDDGKDIFVHYSHINDTFKSLAEGQFVECEVFEDDKGLMARNVVKL